MEAGLHTYRHMDEDLTTLHEQLVQMGELVQRQLTDALRALVERDAELARRTIERDDGVDYKEVEIDDLCIRLLARYQPTARDLRLITTGLKITTDLERIGDLAVNIGECALRLIAEPPLLELFDISAMGRLAQRMVRESLEAFVRADAALAIGLCGQDDEVDALDHQLFRILYTFMAEKPETISRVIQLLFVASCLERVADHATNIAEMVVYLVRGKSIRHLASLSDAAA